MSEELKPITINPNRDPLHQAILDLQAVCGGGVSAAINYEAEPAHGKEMQWVVTIQEEVRVGCVADTLEKAIAGAICEWRKRNG